MPPTDLPRRNRVLPTGEIVAHPARGTLMGNRGCLHDAAGRINRPFVGRRWIACVLAFKGRRRALMQPGRYTELFFLDEATALSAGHRPCAECRRADYDRFRDAWAAAFGQRPGADAMDRVLHEARIDRTTRRQALHTAAVDSLPDGAFIAIDGIPHLVARAAAHPFSPAGYGSARPLPAGRADVLTPKPILRVLLAGYVASCHVHVTQPRH